ncbi:secondary thiamine-phosphate synthase enzyme YjbQ [Acidihalobacter prosperus]
MTTQQFKIVVETSGRGIYELTNGLVERLKKITIHTGLCHVFVCHTSASLMLSENVDPDVRRDLEAFMSRLVPDGDPLFRHQNEGPDDMPAHVRSVLTGNDLTLPVKENRLALGTWQGVFLWEHRTGPQHRKVIVTVQGD